MRLLAELTEKEMDIILSLIDLGFRQSGATRIVELTQVYNTIQKAKTEKKVAVPSGPIPRSVGKLAPEENPNSEVTE